MSTALRVPGLVRLPALVARTVVRRRALARWRPLRLESWVVSLLDSWPGRQTVLLERPAVVPGSPPGPAVRREQSVVALACSRLRPAWLLALPAHPLLQAAWHCPVLQERSVAVLLSRSWARGEPSAAKSKPRRGMRTRELQRACSQPELAWKHLPARVYRCHGRE
jgi:hypothetical protein